MTESKTITAFRSRGTPEGPAWVLRPTAHVRTDTAKMSDAAGIESTRARGLDEPAPRR